MCGIVGLFAKSSRVEEKFGQHLSAMLIEMADRGPDSAGVAVYRNGVPEGWTKVTLCHRQDPAYDWDVLAAQVSAWLGETVPAERRGSHAVLRVPAALEKLRPWLDANHPDIRLVSAGTKIEIFKEKGHPRDVSKSFQLEDINATHGLGHTRMATESAVTTAHSHPFSTGLDLCLVHNGSLSNHNRLRMVLERRGIEFQTDNDSEVAAGYLTWRLREGDDLETALKAASRDLDGFYTFAVGTRDGFAVMRDPIACKHAVLAETDEWVAMATEFRAIAVLPGAEKAAVWEPQPGRVYSWNREGATVSAPEFAL